ncbi:MAG: cytochrome c oxidase subunit II transmembrane domain-containing protein, partial [Pseudomonadota bacterium]
MKQKAKAEMTVIIQRVLAVLIAVIGFSAPALAAAPEPWQLNFQPPASDLMAEINDFHWLLLVIITAITVFVLALLLWVMFRYRESANPTPSKTTHNTTIEVIWTAAPVAILVLISIYSFPLIYAEEKIKNTAEMTVKAIGFQWAWA